MLREISHVQQVPSDYFRRWFADENLDLIVWHKPDQTIYGFQLAYDRSWRHRALTWTEDRGYSHDRIDDGEDSPLANRSPVLSPGDTFEADAVLARFRTSARYLPVKTKIFVRQKIKQYGKREGGPVWIYPLVGFHMGFIAGMGFFFSLTTFAEWWQDRSLKIGPK